MQLLDDNKRITNINHTISSIKEYLCYIKQTIDDLAIQKKSINTKMFFIIPLSFMIGLLIAIVFIFTAESFNAQQKKVIYN